MKLPLRKLRDYVKGRTVFTGNSVYGDWTNGLYVVYSYGTHHPLFIYSPEEQQWFENSTRYSNTTSRHLSACHPHCDTIQKPSQWMKDLIEVRDPEILRQREVLTAIPMC